MLQALNILENADLKAMGYNSPAYIHTLYQAMNLAFADRDFYYGDPDFPPEEPVQGPALARSTPKQRFAQIDWAQNDPDVEAGRSVSVPGRHQSVRRAAGALDMPGNFAPTTRRAAAGRTARRSTRAFYEAFHAGTTSIEAADEEGWVVSVTPSGGWVPAVIAGRTGIGLSQRMQSFVTDPADGPFNVIEPGKRPRVTLTPTLAMKDGAPYLAFAVQGGDTQDQNLLQFFLNVVEFGMTVQQAVEAPNINSYQMRQLFGAHESPAGRACSWRRRMPGVDAGRAAAHGLHAAVRGAHAPARSTRSSSTGSTARCGAGRATTARTTGSPGSATAQPRRSPRSVAGRGPRR